MILKTAKINVKNLSVITQCKGVIYHPFKAAKIIVFGPWSCKKSKSLQDELLTWTSQLRTGQPFIICNSSSAHSLLYHMHYRIDQHDTSSSKGTFGFFCTSWVTHNDFCCFKMVTYDALTLCYKLMFFTLIYGQYKSLFNQWDVFGQQRNRNRRQNAK